MRIGIFTDCYKPQVNGVVTSVQVLSEELTRLGHDVFIITIHVPNHKDQEENIIRLPSIPFYKWKEFRLAMPIHLPAYRQIRDLDLDLIHTHTEFSIGLFGRYIAQKRGIPLLHTYHTMYEDYTHYVSGFKPGKKLIRKMIIKSSKLYVKKHTALIAPSSKTKRALESYGVKKPIYILPTGIDLKHFQGQSRNHPQVQALRDQWQLDIDQPILLSLGRISQEKSIDTILYALPGLLKQHPRAKLLIVGDGPYKKELESLVTRLGLDQAVIFTGQVSYDQVPFYYSLASLFVNASKSESQGLTIFEAMAANLPLVVYDDSNIEGIVIHEVSGRLFKTQEELSDQLIKALDYPNTTRKYAYHAKDIINSLSKESFGKNAEGIYQELVN